MPQVAGLPGVCWGVRSMLQLEGRQNWIPETMEWGGYSEEWAFLPKHTVKYINITQVTAHCKDH